MRECFLPFGGLKMERSLSSLKFEVGDSVVSVAHTESLCNACGEIFDAPLLATVSSDNLVEEYYACPKCLSKVLSVERREQEEVDDIGGEDSPRDIEAEDIVAKKAGCAHHLGYLKSRPKKNTIPEECLTCSKMIECMY
jgi:DNA-directed RNA polymerase subunit RPC12/RpoP